MGLAPKERKREFSNNHQQLSAVNGKAASCM